MKVIFLGTPEFSVPVFDAILNSHHEVVAAVCQMDKPSGRGNKLTPPELKLEAMRRGVPVYQFPKIRRDGVQTLKSLNADIMVTAAYGQILSQEIIDICEHGIINVHGSLLPKYRGASPIQMAIINGEKTTGVTIMKTEAGIDTGDVLLSAGCDILDDDTYGTLSAKLSHLGAELCVRALDLIESGNAEWKKQDEALATHTKMIKKEDTIINFNKTASDIVNLVRGLNPNPVALMYIAGEGYKVYKAKEVPCSYSAPAGTILEASGKKGLIIKCEGSAVEIEELTAPNSKKMTAKSYLNGKKLPVGSVCNE